MTHYRNATVELVALLLCLQPMSIFASAKSSTQLGTTWAHYGDENIAAENITKLIESYSRVAGYWANNSFSTLPSYETTPNIIYSAASGEGHEYSITFYKGHGGSDAPFIPWWQQWFIYDENGNKVYDCNIFPHSGSHSVRFAFLWACNQGDVIGGDHLIEAPFGMPFAWLHTTSLSDDGYLSPDNGGRTFIGFNRSAPQLLFDYWSDNGAYLPAAGYKFLSYFYLSALCLNGYFMHTPMTWALDYAAQHVWGVARFNDSIAYKGYTFPDGSYSQMKVYGDGNLQLSTATPVSLMKTKTDGYFYVPQSSPNALRIEKLFSNQDLAGDQDGGTGPYLGPWPDGSVDGTDSIFISRKFGKREGDSGWNYMGDINHDNVIDGGDLIIVSRNYGKNGTYDCDWTNLQGVTVEFNNGTWIWSPDFGGFVDISQDATNFTIKQNGSPIGAMVSFWFKGS